MAVFAKFKYFFFVKLRIFKFQFLSTCKNIIGNPSVYSPVLMNGLGQIKIGKNVQFGVLNSQGLYEGYSYLEVRNRESKIEIGNNVAINNCFSAVCASNIKIGNDVLIGYNCAIIDNDGHDLHPENRNNIIISSKNVIIEKNVFLGSNVSILKGVTIGENSVIGNSSVVSKNIPANVVAAGNPIRIIRNL